MNILAEITGVRYKLFMQNELKEIDIEYFDINSIPAYCLVKSHNQRFAISRWVSPKRTRSYPYERVYNTLSVSKKITVIPVVKDEGAGSDRDYVQWDTVSLMSLLDVYVIFAYYNSAEKHKRKCDKITNQQFDNDYVINKIDEIKSFHSSALHWNLKEVKETLPPLIDKIDRVYSEIGNLLNIKFHGSLGLKKLKQQFELGVNNFMETSRSKAKDAQHREHLTIQPKEILSTLSKATITIQNYLGGLYYFTTDEIVTSNDRVYLIEGKHSSTAKLPGIADIKDGLLKMILYCNLTNVKIDKKSYEPFPILKLTSAKLEGFLKTASTEQQKDEFFKRNSFSENNIQLINKLIAESKSNKFDLIIQGA